MTSIQGRVVEVSIHRIATNLAVDELLADTILTVENADAFAEKTGQVRIAGVVYDYTSASSELDTIVLATGLTAAAETGTEIELWPQSSEKWARVQLNTDEDVVLARIPHQLADRMPEGVREESAQEVVIVTEEYGAWVVDNVIGILPVIEGTTIQTSGVPNSERIEIIKGTDEYGHPNAINFYSGLGTDPVYPASIRGRMHGTFGSSGESLNMVSPVKEYVDGVAPIDWPLYNWWQAQVEVGDAPEYFYGLAGALAPRINLTLLYGDVESDFDPNLVEATPVGGVVINFHHSTMSHDNYIDLRGTTGGVQASRMRMIEGTFTDATTGTTTSTAGVSMGARGGMLAFRAPQSGTVRVDCHGGVSNSGGTGNVGFQVKTGSSLGGGTLVEGINVNHAVRNAGTSFIFATATAMIEGLTPGDYYNLEQFVWSTTGGTTSFQRGRIMMTPEF